MECRNIVLLGLLSLVAAVPILGRPAQSLASVYFGSPTRSTSENLNIKRYVTAGDRAYEVGTLDGAFPQFVLAPELTAVPLLSAHGPWIARSNSASPNRSAT